jgi:hypothetical protein
MPEFSAEVDIDPSEFIDSCSKKEIQRLVEILVEDGHIEPNQTNKIKQTGVKRPTPNDQIFWDSLDHLAKCRDMLSTFEENYINNMAAKYKHLR